jgi:amidohydrolase
MKPDFITLSNKLEQYVVDLRRQFHAHPELAGQEIWTSERIALELKSIGIPCKVDHKRNVVAKLTGSETGKKIALRADFDALPITEETGLSFASLNPGCMHACGHDGHVASLLGAAQLLVSLKDQLNGTVYFCFQMGEEIAEGALEIIDTLEQDGGVDTVLGTHLMPNLPVGTIAVADGPQMAGVLDWTLTVQGRGGHGSSPWLSVDPIQPACDILGRITALTTNRVSLFDRFVVSPCQIHSGTAHNIIPENAVISGTLRYFREETLAQVLELIADIAEKVAASYGCTAVFTRGNNCRPVLNESAAVARCNALAPALGITVEPLSNPFMGSDNIGEMIAKYGGAYYFSGVAKPGGSPVGIHHPKYDIDESALVFNTRLMAAFSYDFLNEE